MLTLYWVPRNSGESVPRLKVMGDTGRVQVAGQTIEGGIKYLIPENDTNRNFIATMAPPYYKEMPKGEKEVKVEKDLSKTSGVKTTGPIRDNRGSSRVRSSNRGS